MLVALGRSLDPSELRFLTRSWGSCHGSGAPSLQLVPQDIPIVLWGQKAVRLLVGPGSSARPHVLRRP